MNNLLLVADYTEYFKTVGNLEDSVKKVVTELDARNMP